MRKSVFDSSLNLVISVLVIIFIVSIGFFEINSFMEIRSIQLLNSDVNSVISLVDYLAGSNSAGSFLQATISVPRNQTITFDNLTDSIILEGLVNDNISLNYSISNYLQISREGVYDLTICYRCEAVKDYLVVIE